MTRSNIIAAALLAALAVPAAATAAPATEPSARHFTHHGVDFTYVDDQRGVDRVLEGTGDGRKFRLVVRGNKVSGTYNGQLVYFDLPRTASKPVRDRLAAR